MPSFSADERLLLDRSLESYYRENYGADQWRLLARNTACGYGRDNWKTYAELGWLGVALPETFGGAAGGMTETGIVMAAVGRHLALEPVLGTVVLAAGAIELAGTARQRERLLRQIVAGETVMAFCHYEPGAGYERRQVKTIARQVGDSFVLDGEKSFTLGADSADHLIVSARLRSASGPVALFVVSNDREGLAPIGAPAFDGRFGAAVRLAGVHVPLSARLGDREACELPAIDRLLDRGAIAVCAEACGAMAALTQVTIDYLKIREQFGQPLARFQVLQHRLVDMSLAVEEARATVHAALQALDDGTADAQRAVWIAKVKAGRSARFVGTQGIQLHGGMGMTDELTVGHFYKRLTMCETLFGDADWYLDRLAEAQP
ncbi:MAG: acyl-CoA dehydrogenase family protein [Alphaproteobacteria bacterium]|nr:acyl-CoA dehydrogenase family protein [Alphaproteobacteria bacterium]